MADHKTTAARPQRDHNANTDRSQDEHVPFTNKNVKNEKNEKNGKKGVTFFLFFSGLYLLLILRIAVFFY